MQVFWIFLKDPSAIIEERYFQEMFSSAVIQIVLKKINAINVYTILIHDLNKISLRYKEYICQKKGTRSICNWRKCKFIGSTIESTIDSCDREEERRYLYIYIYRISSVHAAPRRKSLPLPTPPSQAVRYFFVSRLWIPKKGEWSEVARIRGRPR